MFSFRITWNGESYGVIIGRQNSLSISSFFCNMKLGYAMFSFRIDWIVKGCGVIIDSCGICYHFYHFKAGYVMDKFENRLKSDRR